MARRMIFSTGSRRAFTLIELLVVMAIVGLLVATSVPALARYAGQVKLRAATRDVVGLLSLSRSLAIGSRSPRTVVIDDAGHRLFIEETAQTEPRIVRVSSSMTVEAATLGEPGEPVRSLVFKPTGSLEGGRSASILLTSGPRTQTITVTSTTGSISVQ